MRYFEIKKLAESGDRTHGSAFDRGSADAWYHRPKNPHKVVNGQQVKLTDPEEIAAYHAGFKETYDDEGPHGGKQYESIAEDWGKKYGIRYKIFAGREQRLTIKEAWFKTAEHLQKASEKIQELDGFYEFDGFSIPRE